ncbi:MAG: exonuclease SbcCD subunit D [Caldilineaceae bacterium]|nr:exonuclease SbcCD subunit D [Caldilineaceae bacterium]
MKFKFMHMADAHLGFRQYGHTEREWDFDDAFRWAIDQAVAKQVDFVLLAGDLFQSGSNLQAITFNNAVTHLEVLQDAGIPCLAIEGNHDLPRYRAYRTRFGWGNALAETNRLVYLLDATPLDAGVAPLLACDGHRMGHCAEPIPGVRVYGIGFNGAATRTVLERFEGFIAEHSGDKPDYTILMSHAGVDGRTRERTSSNVSMSGLRGLRSRIDYVALGHYHMKFDEGNWLFNPGSLELTSQDLAHEEAGGIYVVTVDTDADPKHRVDHLACPRRPFVHKAFSLARIHGPEELYAEIEDFLIGERAKCDPDDDVKQPILSIALVGRSRFEPGLVDAHHIEELGRGVLNPLLCRVSNRALPPGTAAFDEVEHMSRRDLEEQVLEGLLESHPDFGQDLTHWTNATLEVMDAGLNEGTGDDICDILGQTRAAMTG